MPPLLCWACLAGRPIFKEAGALDCEVHRRVGVLLFVTGKNQPGFAPIGCCVIFASSSIENLALIIDSDLESFSSALSLARCLLQLSSIIFWLIIVCSDFLLAGL